MSDIKVSEMTELQASEIAEDDLMYIIDKSATSSGSKKVSITSLRLAMGKSSGEDTSGIIYNGNIPDWGGMITVSGIDNIDQSVTIPCDCFVRYTYYDITTATSKAKGCNVNSSIVPAEIVDNGFYCAAGSIIKIDRGTGYKLLVVPLVYANTIDDGVVTIENKTPEEITTFITNNSGAEGEAGKYFKTIADYTGGMYGIDQGSSNSDTNWTIITDPEDSTLYKKFGIKFCPNTNYVIQVLYPNTLDKYQEFKTLGLTTLSKKLVSNKIDGVSSLFSTTNTYAMTQSQFDVVTMKILKLDIKDTQ